MGSIGWVRALCCGLAASWALVSPLSAVPLVELVSRAVPELQSDTTLGGSTTSRDNSRGAYTHAPRASADGRWIVFTSDSPNLAASQIDANRLPDVFLHDRQIGTTILVSRAAGTTATTANHGSFRPSLSADGRYVAFLSCATNLVPGQVDELPFSWYEEQDVFLFDRITETMVLVSRKDGTTATAASGEGWDSSLSADGRFVAFLNTAPDLVAGQIDPDLTPDLFLYDRQAGTTKLISHRDGSPQTAAGADTFALSGNGGWLAFLSQGADLVPGQVDVNSGENAGFDLFLHEVSSGAIALVTHASGSPGTTGNSGSETDIPSISADGSRVAFATEATDLVAGTTDTNDSRDVFLYDRIAGTTTLISSEDPGVADGGIDPAISGNGARIAFVSQANVLSYEVASGTTTLVSHASSSGTQEGNASSQNPIVTGDGTRVLFESEATDLVTDQADTEGTGDLFLFDQASGTISLVNHASGSATTPAPNPGFDSLSFQDPFLTDDGHAVFTSWSDDLVSGLRDRNGRPDVFLYAPSTGGNQAISVHAPSLLSATANEESNSTSMSADGRFVVFASRATDLIPGQDDRNGNGIDIFLHDRVTGETSLVSHAAGLPAATGNMDSSEATISRDGSFIVFSSLSTDLITAQTDLNGLYDLFLYERTSGLVALVSHVAGSASVTGNAESTGGRISADGGFIAFSSNATNLISGVSKAAGRPDAFLHDRLAGTTTLVSHSAGLPSQAAGGSSEASSLSADGRFLAFTSTGLNLISGQVHGNDGFDDEDVFLYDRVSGETTLVSRVSGLPTTTASGASNAPELSGNGRFVAFRSEAVNLMPGQTGGGDNLFLHDCSTGSTVLISHASGSVVAPATHASYGPSIDDNGDFIVFESLALNLMTGQVDELSGTMEPDEDIFLYDRRTATNTLVSHTAGSAVTGANHPSRSPRISGDGTQIAFLSSASDLMTGQPLSGFDAFLYHRLKGTTTLLTPAVGPPNSPDIIPPFDTLVAPPSISPGGHFIALTGEASSLVAQDYNNALDVFLSSDPVPPADFFTLTPCRLLDTRQPGHGPALTSGAPRTLLAHGICGIPETASALAINVTVLEASGNGNLTAFPGDFLIPPLASTLNFAGLQTRANNAMVPLAPDGTLGLQAFVAASGTVHAIIDVSGYYE